MLNKEELVKSIEELPKFEKKDVAVKKVDEKGWIWKEDEDVKAITEEGKDKILTVVSKDYSLVQFREIFLPIVNDIGSVEGDVQYWFGRAKINLFPIGEEYKVGKDRIGISLKNSVNKSWAVKVNFSILVQDKYVVTVPMREWKKIHIGDVEARTKDFLKVAGDVKKEWKEIIDSFGKYTITEEILDELAKIFGKRVVKILEKKMENEVLTLWDGFLIGIDSIAGRKYKSEIHKVEKLDRVVKKIMDYAMALKLIGGV